MRDADSARRRAVGRSWYTLGRRGGEISARTKRGATWTTWLRLCPAALRPAEQALLIERVAPEDRAGAQRRSPAGGRLAARPGQGPGAGALGRGDRRGAAGGLGGLRARVTLPGVHRTDAKLMRLGGLVATRARNALGGRPPGGLGVGARGGATPSSRSGAYPARALPGTRPSPPRRPTRASRGPPRRSTVRSRRRSGTTYPTTRWPRADEAPVSVLGVRDRALLLLGFAGAFRRSELVGLDVVTLRRSKTDQEGAGREVGIPYGSTPATCRVRAVGGWLRTRTTDGPAHFCPMDRHRPAACRGASATAVARVVQRTAAAAGLRGGSCAGHSLRAGLASLSASAWRGSRSATAPDRRAGHLPLRPPAGGRRRGRARSPARSPRATAPRRRPSGRPASGVGGGQRRSARRSGWRARARPPGRRRPAGWSIARSTGPSSSLSYRRDVRVAT